MRFARLRMEKRHNYVRKVAETAVQLFVSNDKVNVAGMVLAGSADFKTELSQSDMFDPVNFDITFTHFKRLSEFYCTSEITITSALLFCSETSQYIFWLEYHFCCTLHLCLVFPLQRLQAKVLKLVDISYGGENGFNQAIELSAEVLSNVKFIQEKKLIGESSYSYIGKCALPHKKGFCCGRISF